MVSKLQRQYSVILEYCMCHIFSRLKTNLVCINSRRSNMYKTFINFIFLVLLVLPFCASAQLESLLNAEKFTEAFKCLHTKEDTVEFLNLMVAKIFFRPDEDHSKKTCDVFKEALRTYQIDDKADPEANMLQWFSDEAKNMSIDYHQQKNGRISAFMQEVKAICDIKLVTIKSPRAMSYISHYRLTKSLALADTIKHPKVQLLAVSVLLSEQEEIAR